MWPKGVSAEGRVDNRKNFVESVRKRRNVVRRRLKVDASAGFGGLLTAEAEVWEVEGNVFMCRGGLKGCFVMPRRVAELSFRMREMGRMGAHRLFWRPHPSF
ncbi:MAG: hypothetical protein ACTS6H_02010 [Candidatus Hodgkinia cicadicola]